MAVRVTTERAARPVHVIGVASGRWGGGGTARHGADGLRAAGLLDRLRSRGIVVEDVGDVPILADDRGSIGGHELDRPRAEQMAVLRRQVRDDLLGGAFPLVVGGRRDCKAASQSGVASACRALGWEVPGLIWFGAHADVAGEPSLAAMAALLGLPAPGLAECVGGDGRRDPLRIAMVAQRAVGADERETLDRLGVRLFDQSEVRRRGIDACMAEALVRVAGDDGRFSLSYDLDALDASIAQCAGSPAEHGLSLDEARIAVDMIAEHGGLLELDIGEADPSEDPSGRSVHVALEAAATLLGPLALG